MMSGKKGFLFILFFCCFCSAAFATPKTSLERVRYRQANGYVRFVFDATNSVRYKKSQLANPPRLILDIQNANIAGNLNFPLSRKNPVKRIRAIDEGNGDLRLELDLKYLSNVRIFTLPPASFGKPYRLVVDFLAKGVPTKPIRQTKPKRDVIVVIDPGHGGKDPGATGPRGTHEKNITLAISKKLEAILDRQPGFDAVLTRKRDVYISLRKRLSIARRYKADMFVAIHADAYRDRSARGASVYALSGRGATSEAARWLAKRENASELMGGVNLSDKGSILKSVLLNLSQTATIRASLMIGGQMIHYLDRIAYLHHHRVEQAAFVVLKSPDIPSLLIETGFLSNHYEERRLRDPAYQHRLALAIAQGIRSYFTHRPPRNTWLAYWRDHPRANRFQYVVHRGDTLSGIAQRYRISVRELAELNQLRTANLSEGQVLTIPKS